MGEAPQPKFLAVDDEPLAKRSYGRLLRRYGETTVVASVAEAKERLVGDTSWDAFLLDLRLRDGTGFEVLDYGRRRFPETPAVLISGYVEGWVVNRAYDLGASALSHPWAARPQHTSLSLLPGPLTTPTRA